VKSGKGFSNGASKRKDSNNNNKYKNLKINPNEIEKTYQH
jgi:hypothetical protein